MKRVALRFLFLCAVITLGTICTSTLSAQDVEELTATHTDVLSRKYLRPSRSVIFATDGSSAARQLVQIMQSASNDQFDTNKIALQELRVTPPEKPANTKEGREALQEEITKALEEQQVGRQIMKCWFPTFDNNQKGYSLQVLEERGAFAATDADVVEAKAGQRGLSVQLNALGEQLIDRSYVVVYYVYLLGGKTPKTEAFVYKLDFGPETRESFYNDHYNTPDGIDQGTFPLKFIYATKEDNATDLYLLKRMAKRESLSDDIKDDEVAANLLQMADVLIANNVHDFETQATIVQTSPISAKIGTKENLKTDDRFYVVENVLDPLTGEPKTVRRGAVRVGRHIADNNFVADGNLEDFTHFYQYAGFRKLEEGMTLISKPDRGIGITPLANFMYVGVEADYRVSDLIKLIPGLKGKTIPGLFSFVRIALPFYLKASDEGGFGVLVSKEATLLLRMTFGLRKEFNFARALNASLEVGCGSLKDIISKEEDTSKKFINLLLSLITGYVTVGARFGFYANPNVNIFAHAGYEIWLLNVFTEGEGLGITPYNFGLGMRFSF